MIRCLFAFAFLFLHFSAHASAKISTRTTSEQPSSINDEGDYIYQAKDPVEAVYYKVDNLPPTKGAFYMRFGTVGPYNITGDSGATYERTYTDKGSFLLFLEYERYLGHLLGKWTLKIGTGFSVEQGNGRFINDPVTVPEEKFLFLVLPNTAMFNYKLKFSDSQLFIPYLEAGPGYFTFVEYRTDGGKTNFGGAGVLAAGGGVLISMNLLDSHAAGTMYEDYGVNHIWFDLQFRRYQGLDNQKDFSSNMITGGFGFGF